MANITTLEAGYCTHPACMVEKGAGWKACRFPARIFLICVGTRHWLWDTGYASHFYDYTRQGIFVLYRKLTPVYFSPQESAVAQLKLLGLDVSDLSGLILSHFHGDHIAGLRDFPNTNYYCSGDGWQRTRVLRGVAALGKGFVPGLIPEKFDRQVCFMEVLEQVNLPAALQPFTDGYVLPDARNEVFLVDLPGHAAGHIGAFVLTDTGWKLLASDTGWNRRSYEELSLPSPLTYLIMDNVSAFKDTLNRVHVLHRGGQCDILLSHEEDV